MLKYVSFAISFTEVPDEVCLAVQVSNCGHRCYGCHSPYLQKNRGEDLERDLFDLLRLYASRVTCVCFMGDGGDPEAMFRCALMVHKYGLKAAVYTGNNEGNVMMASSYNGCEHFDYVKTGEYDIDLGGLSSPTTNQRMFKWNNDNWEDITYKFWKKKDD